MKFGVFTTYVGHLGTGYGMPSSHAQFIWYFATYGILYLYTHMTLEHGAWKSVATLAIFTLALLVSFSRIYLGYHTVYQVQVGAGIENKEKDKCMQHNFFSERSGRVFGHPTGITTTNFLSQHRISAK
ncbi:uncharacterized protein BYT42DRAFT_290732 [Radiomyces spectabilis]|uniref:uncharacterized protein n=1 Tax=Radiomyces spectabilis TaxID=64574 RepID=UPI00221E41FD|nr:uncharacterized protein BYT42DRAFT_290732 [Radiomyces spectabilis]KAI8381063.1 hypothetical protein BYT42DRAFT_290732 [Radiomyces spectabilis]